MVTLLGNIQLKQLNQQAKYICSTKITWEYYINKRRITQCRRCQGWGHATVNCYAEPACLKCAEGHLTQDCNKSKDVPAKCVNCGEDHPANATICQEYQKRLKNIELRNKTQLDKNTTKSTNIKNIPDINDRKQYPNLLSTSTNQPQPTTANSHQHHNQYERYNSEQEHIPTSRWSNTISAKAFNSNINRSSTNNRLGNEYLTTSYTNQSNVNDLSDFVSLSNEIRELTKVFNVKRMLSAVREFRKQLQHCETPSQQFQLLIQFCDKIDNE